MRYIFDRAGCRLTAGVKGLLVCVLTCRSFWIKVCANCNCKVKIAAFHSAFKCMHAII